MPKLTRCFCRFQPRSLMGPIVLIVSMIWKRSNLSALQISQVLYSFIQTFIIVNYGVIAISSAVPFSPCVRFILKSLPFFNLYRHPTLCFIVTCFEGAAADRIPAQVHKRCLRKSKAIQKFICNSTVNHDELQLQVSGLRCTPATKIAEIRAAHHRVC